MKGPLLSTEVLTVCNASPATASFQPVPTKYIDGALQRTLRADYNSAMPARSELRRKPRRQFHYHASILVEGDKPFVCAIADISETGARIQLEDERELPDRFILLLTRNGDARRHCAGRRAGCQ